MGFLSKIKIWEDRSNCLDDVDSRPDAHIHKASCAFKIQTSGQQPSWSGRASYLYGKNKYLINRSDDHSIGLDMTQIRKEFQRNFGKHFAQLFVRTPYVHCPDGA
jgi:hypothetical protein